MYTARQRISHAICTISLRSLHHNLDESGMKFLLNVNCDGKPVHEIGPWSNFQLSMNISGCLTLSFLFQDELIKLTDAQVNGEYTFSYQQRFSLSTPWHLIHLMTSSNGNIFRVTGPLCGEFTHYRWIALINASDAKLWCVRWTAWINSWENNRVSPVIWDAIAPIMTSL